MLLTGPGGIGVYSAADSRMQLLTRLGFRPSPYVGALTSGRCFEPISPELLEQADADVVVLLDRTGSPLADVLARSPTIATTSAYAEGRLYAVEDCDVAPALSGTSVLSIPFATEAMLPGLRAALG